MRVINICCNYGSYKDGIGAYSKKMTEAILRQNHNINIDTITSDIADYGKIKRVLSLKMTKNLFKAYRLINKEKVDILNIEYPFTEWNPCIIIPYSLLAKRCKKNEVTLFISLHEYARTNSLRKKIIRYLVKRADKVFVTEETMKQQLKVLNPNIHIRHIPSNIQITKEKNIETKEKNQFVFFGLINKSKAFDEMIEAWKQFQSDNKECKLLILTSSNIEIEKANEYNIDLMKNLNDDQIEDMMSKSTYCVLPIRPDVNFNNATLKTSCMFNCIPIGKFNEQLERQCDFIINMKDYTINDFKDGFNKALHIENIKQKQEEAEKFGSQFDINNIAKEILNVYNERRKYE